MKLRSDLERVLTQWEANPSLTEPSRVRERIEVLDRIDALACGTDRDSSSEHHALIARAAALRRRLEEANQALSDSIRAELRRDGSSMLLRELVQKSREQGSPEPGLSYDYLDEVVAGVLDLRDPGNVEFQPQPNAGSEMVFYQPAPARHIFDMLETAALSRHDVLVDLGSGLGHVPILASIFSPARSLGVEIEPAYVRSARECADRLNLNRVSFEQADARQADLSEGTVFFLYTPFTGLMLRTVLDRLRKQAAHRPIQMCTFGPCTNEIARESWLRAQIRPDPDRITRFDSRIATGRSERGPTCGGSRS